jgi:hypothetical protein
MYRVRKDAITPRAIGTVVTAVSVLVLQSFALQASQNLAGVQASWHDLDTWTHVIADTKQNEYGLGLQPSGSLVAFLARVPSAAPRTAPRQIRVQIATNALANPNLVRRSVLTFLADAETVDRVSFDLSGSLVVDDSTPGGNLQNGIATMNAGDFARIARAETLSGNVFGFDVVFTRDQIAAMKAFAVKLNLMSARD